MYGVLPYQYEPLATLDTGIDWSSEEEDEEEDEDRQTPPVQQAAVDWG